MALPLDQVLREAPLTGLALMFGAGLVTSLTPCVYPMIPIVAGVLGGAGAGPHFPALTPSRFQFRYEPGAV